MNAQILVTQAIDDYPARGWSIIPIRSGDKRPLVRWEEFQYRRPRRGEVQGWFSGWPEAGIGIVTGGVSGLVVLDIDPRHGGEASLERLERQHGRLPATVECRSGGGGRHLYFAHPGGLLRNQVGLAPGVDLRGDGGYVVAPPTLHASGVRYTWVGDRRGGMVDVAPLPDWVLRPAIERPRRLGHPIPTGVGSCGRASAKVHGTTRSRRWPGICCGTVWTPRSCWRSCGAGTVSAASRLSWTRRSSRLLKASRAFMDVTTVA
jgi:hypothetical protein